MADQQNPQGARVKPLSQVKTADELCSLLDSLKRRRTRQEIDWRLNLAYYRGNQYTYWNPTAKRIESVPTEDGEKPRYRVRIVANQVQTGTDSLISKVIRTKPIFSATPGKPGDDAVKAAEFSETLLEGWWRDMELSSKYEEAVKYSIHCGAGYWFISWDQFANKALKFLMDPNGNPLPPDSAEEKEFRVALEQAGIPPQEKVVYVGDLKVEVLSPFHVWGDPTKSEAHEWKWCVVQHNMDPDDVKARYGKDIVADAVAANPDQTLPMGNAEDAGEPNVVKVYCLYHLPTPSMPKGRYVEWTESGGKQILRDDPWPWEGLTKLPIVQFKGISVPGMAEGDALTTHARPLQKQLNRMLSQITEYFNLTIRPQWMAPINSFQNQRMTNEPGVFWEYTPVAAAGGGALKPEPVQLPTIPAYVFQFLDQIGGRLREVYGLTEVTEGQLPPNLEAADAIDMLQEMATDRFVPTIESNERGLARAGQILLDLAQQYYSEQRFLTVRGFGGAAHVKAFTKADFAGDTTVHVEAGSSLPRTKAMRRKQIEQWISIGLLDPRKAWRYYDIADIKDLAVDFAMDEDHALREHEKIIAGIPLNPEHYEQAVQVAQTSPVNPETGQPWQGVEEIKSFIEQAALAPGPADNAAVHIEKHAKWIKSMEFENFQPDIRHRAFVHFMLTNQQLSQQKPLPEPQAPKVSLQLKGTVGPTAEAEILQASGVQIDPQTLASEPPMETMVVDSVDKPDADAAGPGQEANHLSQVAATMVQADIANATAQLKNAQSVEQHRANQAQQADLHEHAVRKAAADATLAERKAQETSFAPKPASNKPAQSKKKPRKG